MSGVPASLFQDVLNGVYSMSKKKNKNAMKKKADFPQKVCPVCQRPFSWRKKWATCWDEVKYCSKRCRGERNLSG